MNITHSRARRVLLPLSRENAHYMLDTGVEARIKVYYDYKYIHGI